MFLKATKTHNVYAFDCPGCGAAGEIGVPKASHELITHECGAAFIQLRPAGLFAKPMLVDVISKASK